MGARPSTEEMSSSSIPCRNVPVRVPALVYTSNIFCKYFTFPYTRGSNWYMHVLETIQSWFSAWVNKVLIGASLPHLGGVRRNAGQPHPAASRYLLAFVYRRQGKKGGTRDTGRTRTMPRKEWLLRSWSIKAVLITVKSMQMLKSNLINSVFTY